jgi:hypothetical protein
MFTYTVCVSIDSTHMYSTVQYSGDRQQRDPKTRGSVILIWGWGEKGGGPGISSDCPVYSLSLTSFRTHRGWMGGEGGGGLVSSTEPVGEGCTPVVDTE